MSKVERNPHAIYFDEPGVTQQSFKDECDINNILARARNGEAITHLNARIAQYGDFSSIPDYRTALDQVNRAQAMFMCLDAQVRERFANDPAKFLDFCMDPKNGDEMVRMGLRKPQEAPAEPVVEPEAAGEQLPAPASAPAKPGVGANVEKPKGVSK